MLAGNVILKYYSIQLDVFFLVILLDFVYTDTLKSREEDPLCTGMAKIQSCCYNVVDF